MRKQGMTGESSESEPLYLKLETEHRDGYFHIYAAVVTREKDTPRGIGDRYSAPFSFDDLRIVSQGNDDDDAPANRSVGRGRHLYAWEIRYQSVYAIDAGKAQRMHHTLSTLARKLEQVSAKQGPPESFAQYVLRVGAVLKVHGYVVNKSPRKGQWYADGDWRWMDASDAHYWMSSAEQTWRNERSAVERAEAERAAQDAL